MEERVPMPGKRHFRFLGIAILLPLVVILAVALPGVSAGGDEDMDEGHNQAPPLPEKAELEYPQLGSRLNGLVVRVEEGEMSAGEATEDTAVHQEESVAVTLHLSRNVAEVVSFLQRNGGDPRNVGEDYIEAYIPVSLLGQVSEQPGILRVREIVPPQPDFGDFTSQGVQTHGSPAWNRAGYTGQGVKVGIIDVGFAGFRGLMGTELPATVVARCYTDIGVFTQDPYDCEAENDHGTIVAETVIDIAPEVSLYIANPVSRGDLRETVAWMVSEGVVVINESQGWLFDGPGDGTSPFSNSPLNTVDRAVDGGAVWVNSAGNYARRTWFGDYADTDGDDLVSFAEPNIEFVGLDVKEGDRVAVQLRWEDDWAGAATDLDLYLYNAGTRLFTDVTSEDEQSGKRGQVPLERFGFTLDGDSNAFAIVVNHHSGGIPDWIQLVVWRVAEIEHYTGNGSINSPSESANTGLLAVGAAHWDGVRSIERYSSRGPTPDGRVKPDIVGADCGETALSPLNERQRGFCGTSQAAPHMAGMAALVKQRFPDYTPQQVADYLKDNAAQRESPDPNNTWGHGFAQMPSSQVSEAFKEAERTALVALYNATGGPNWTNNANWMSSQPVGLWHGVTTDPRGRVVGLSLPENGLTGEIPTELGSLASLTWLSLSENQLTGEMPTELGSLSGLTGLWLHENQLTGEIPSQLGNLASLTNLVLNDNQLTGEIPAELGSLSNLTTLILGENQLTGPIPTELGSLSNLRVLNLAGNQLTGEIPTELGSLANLQVLNLTRNQLTGLLPSELKSLTSLTRLALGGNHLSGPIPTWLGSLTNLQGLYLWGNPLTGEIPAELGSLANLQDLYLTRNQLTGTIPTELGSLTSLTDLALGGNQLNGPIPTWLGSLTNLQGLYLWGNPLTGEIPAELGSLANLEELDLADNELTGEIPTELGSLANLEELYLMRNQLTGAIPTELGSLTSLTDLALGGNQLTGPIPTWLGSLTNLEGLYLWGNPLTGEIPAELASLTNLERLYLSDNQLTGLIPTWLGSLTSLQELGLYDNDLTGEIPSQLGNLADLKVLSLYGNELTGGIPAELGSLTNLERLYLSDNQLTGLIPTWLGSLTSLQELGLYDNDLTGEIPSQLGNLADLKVLSLYGNELTGGIPAELGSLTNLERLYLSDNQLTGLIPTWLGSLTSLQELGLYDNDLTGEMPSQLGNLADLKVLSLYGNELTGGIPTELGSLTNLEELYLADNELTGEIPTELDSLASLVKLALWGNDLTGEIPSWLGSLANLQVLSLSQNQLTGPIPPQLGSLANLERLWLHYNELSGVVPQTLAGLTMLEDFSFYNNLGLCAPIDDAFQTWLRGISIVYGSSCAQADSAEDRAVLVKIHSVTDGVNWLNNSNWLSDHLTRQWYGITSDANGRVNGLFLRGNQLTGEIPAELGGLADLEVLSLAANGLTGEIPAELGNLTNLESLSLYQNQLTGEIPAELGRLTNLTLLYLSGNQVSGCVPASLRDVADNDFAQLGLPFCTVAPPAGVTATRSFSPASVAPGGQVVVTIAVANYGSAGGVTEKLPAGFTYLSSSLPDGQVMEVDARTVRFTLQGETSYTYTVTASETVGTYSFSGTLRDFDRNDHTVDGASTVTVSSGDPLITRYDANNNGTIEQSEVIKAITDYLFGEGEPINQAEVIKLITLYLFG